VTTLPVLLAVGLAALAFTAAIVPLIRQIACGSGLYEQPVANRWHRRPVAKLGGVAMAIVFFPLALAFTASPDIVRLLLAAFAMFGLGLFDDLRPVRPRTKFLGQLAVAAVFLAFRPTTLTGAPAADLVLAFLWFAGITNAFNLLDNIDGLAAGVAAVCGAGLVALLLLRGDPLLGELAIVTAALVGTAGGFLIYNWQPASIFMGDGGSHLIGATFAGLTLLAAPGLHQELRPSGMLALVLLLVPVADTALVTITRLASGRSPFSGGRDHLSHRLVAIGLTERQAVLALCGLSALGAGAAIALARLPAAAGWGWAAAYATLVAGVALWLGRVRLPTAEAAGTDGAASVRSRGYEILLDGALISLAYYLGLAVRLRERTLFDRFLPELLVMLPVIVGLHLVALGVAGKYRRPAAWNAVREASAIVRGALVGSAAAIIAVLYLTRFEGYSRQAFAIAGGFTLILLAASRFGLHAADELIRRQRGQGRLALVYGAGERGALAVRELQRNRQFDLTPIGIIDDDPAALRTRVEGIRVLGTLDDLQQLLEARQGHVSALVIAAPSLPRERFDRACAVCGAHGIEIRRLRFSLDEVDWAERSADVVRFKR
jgi:UDP-GlcNAc:undecaprenyl-phosphate GlcNAc-1-phosphate transferase